MSSRIEDASPEEMAKIASLLALHNLIDTAVAPSVGFSIVIQIDGDESPIMSSNRDPNEARMMLREMLAIMDGQDHAAGRA